MHCRRPHGPCAACRYTVWDVRKNVTPSPGVCAPGGHKNLLFQKLARSRKASSPATDGMRGRRRCKAATAAGRNTAPRTERKAGIQMSKGTVIDRAGERYGRLVVLERAPSEGAPGARWLCQCDCGRKKIVRAGDLQRGSTRSCGCLQAEKRRKAKKIRAKEIQAQAGRSICYNVYCPQRNNTRAGAWSCSRCRNCISREKTRRAKREIIEIQEEQA